MSRNKRCSTITLAATAALWMAACGSVTLSGQEDAGTNDIDAPTNDVDAAENDACREWTYALYFDPCALPPSDDELVLTRSNSPYWFDTDTGVLRDGINLDVATTSIVLDGPTPIRAISAASIALEPGATLRIEGTMPAVLASWSSIEMQGAIDVSGLGDLGGAGANPFACANNAALPGIPGDNTRGDGGGGGAFANPGGNGGNSTTNGGSGGTPVPLPQELRGGCSGADGADGNSFPGNRGLGGPSGGAVHLSALDQVVVDGVINAGGSGGFGGGINHGGGGGGGSGGLIGLAARIVTITAGAILSANGGAGGGGGGGSNPATPGQNGGPVPFSASGGQGGGGSGGFGGSLESVAGGGQNGGGGGGSVGFIVVETDTLDMNSQAIVSPYLTERDPSAR